MSQYRKIIMGTHSLTLILPKTLNQFLELIHTVSPLKDKEKPKCYYYDREGKIDVKLEEDYGRALEKSESDPLFALYIGQDAEESKEGLALSEQPLTDFECLFCDGTRVKKGKPCKKCKGSGKLNTIWRKKLEKIIEDKVLAIVPQIIEKYIPQLAQSTRIPEISHLPDDNPITTNDAQVKELQQEVKELQDKIKREKLARERIMQEKFVKLKEEPNEKYKLEKELVRKQLPESKAKESGNEPIEAAQANAIEIEHQEVKIAVQVEESNELIEEDVMADKEEYKDKKSAIITLIENELNPMPVKSLELAEKVKGNEEDNHVEAQELQAEGSAEREESDLSKNSKVHEEIADADLPNEEESHAAESRENGTPKEEQAKPVDADTLDDETKKEVLHSGEGLEYPEIKPLTSEILPIVGKPIKKEPIDSKAKVHEDGTEQKVESSDKKSVLEENSFAMHAIMNSGLLNPTAEEMKSKMELDFLNNPSNIVYPQVEELHGFNPFENEATEALLNDNGSFKEEEKSDTNKELLEIMEKDQSIEQFNRGLYCSTCEEEIAFFSYKVCTSCPSHYVCNECFEDLLHEHPLRTETTSLVRLPESVPNVIDISESLVDSPSKNTGFNVLSESLYIPRRISLVKDIGLKDIKIIYKGETPTKRKMEMGEKFEKTWTFLNGGKIEWPEDLELSALDEDVLRTKSERVPSVRPGEMCKVTLTMTAPSVSGFFKQYFAVTWKGKPTGFKVIVEGKVLESPDFELVSFEEEAKDDKQEMAKEKLRKLKLAGAIPKKYEANLLYLLEISDADPQWIFTLLKTNRNRIDVVKNIVLS
eukprot:TRINITY_DN1151_c0_g1_i1.p1 TRINITY_DN1151_c0_g1~~TRINITY_DN1151_c0_g1_i1.p1  ORF type:complete len:821 (+),score=270.87 TRINITY_DN1151_c0_g1_i1:151-2613(+)